MLDGHKGERFACVTFRKVANWYFQSATFDEVEAMAGTGMAALHVNGAVALLLSHWGKQQGKKVAWEQLNAAQIRAAVSQLTQNYASWNPRMGFGVLDAKA